MIDDPIHLKMLKARVRLLIEQPLFGQIIMYLEMEDASSWCPTAATDGRKFYYNRDFIDSLSSEELLFVHGHEVLHVILEHVFRRGDRDKLVWNFAIDLITNFILVKSKIGKMPKFCLYDEKYTDEYSAEQLYDLLMLMQKKMVKIEPSFDMHLDAASSAENTADGTPQLGSIEIEEMRDTMRSALIQAAQNTDVGNIPLGIHRLLNRLTQPKINWRQILVSLLRSTIKYDYTYTRVSRRSWSSGLILPGQDVADRVTAVAWLDGSGSTTQAMITDFLSEVNGIMRTFRDFELTIGTFDTEVYNVEVFTPHNAREINRYQFKGGGGTMPSCCWEYMKSKQLRPQKALIFTDGEVGNDWGDSQYCETVFIIHSNPLIQASYGKTLHYESKS